MSRVRPFLVSLLFGDMFSSYQALQNRAFFRLLYWLVLFFPQRAICLCALGLLVPWAWTFISNVKSWASPVLLCVSSLFYTSFIFCKYVYFISSALFWRAASSGLNLSGRSLLFYLVRHFFWRVPLFRFFVVFSFVFSSSFALFCAPSLTKPFLRRLSNLIRSSYDMNIRKEFLSVSWASF